MDRALRVPFPTREAVRQEQDGLLRRGRDIDACHGKLGERQVDGGSKVGPAGLLMRATGQTL